MELGIAAFATDDGVGPVELARMVEERGLESLWLTEHSHVPVRRETRHPVHGELPREYARTYDAFVALTAAAMATERLRVGTGVCLLVIRDPILTAKAAATLDVVSGGRLLLGVGAGWLLEEMRDHGTDPGTRFALLCERVEAMKAIWTQEEAFYAGRHVAFEPMWSWPKPLTRPHPPVLIGGVGARVEERVLAVGDGWIPMYSDIGDTDILLGRAAALRARADRPLDITVHGGPARAGDLDRMRAAGIDRCTFFVPPGAERSRVERRLDRVAEVAAELAGV
jgi:probable F420-dependent oxidoreductase